MWKRGNLVPITTVEPASIEGSLSTEVPKEIAAY